MSRNNIEIRCPKCKKIGKTFINNDNSLRCWTCGNEWKQPKRFDIDKFTEGVVKEMNKHVGKVVAIPRIMSEKEVEDAVRKEKSAKKKERISERRKAREEDNS